MNYALKHLGKRGKVVKGTEKNKSKMSNRKQFLRDCLLGIAATLVPRVLQPVLPQMSEFYDAPPLSEPINDDYYKHQWRIYYVDNEQTRYKNGRFEFDGNGNVKFIET